MYVLKFEGEGQSFYIPIKLMNSTMEKPEIKHYFYGSACCQTAVSKENICSKCGNKCEAVKVYPNGQPETTGSSDIWDLREVGFEDIDLQKTYMWKYLEQGILRKPKASEIEKMREYQNLQQSGGGNLKALFDYLVAKRRVLLGDIVFREGKKNEFFIKPHFIKTAGKATLLVGILDGNLNVIEPTLQFEIPQAGFEPEGKKKEEKKKEKTIEA